MPETKQEVKGGWLGQMSPGCLWKKHFPHKFWDSNILLSQAITEDQSLDKSPSLATADTNARLQADIRLPQRCPPNCPF